MRFRCFIQIVRSQSGFLSLLASLVSNFLFCQPQDNSYDSSKRIKNARANFAIEIGTNLLPKAKITTDSGIYKLRSRIQSSYSIGLNYRRIMNPKTTLTIGLHLQIGKRNFYSKIHDSGLRGYTDPESPLFLEDKALWSNIGIPFVLEKIMKKVVKNQMLLKLGLTICYSGFSTDEKISGSVFDSISNTKVQIFNADLSGNNSQLPWVTFIGGLTRKVSFDNKNFMLVSLQVNYSPVYFFKGKYQLTIPRRPATTGSYKISGSSLGISVQYVFTGINKRIIRRYQN